MDLYSRKFNSIRTKRFMKWNHLIFLLIGKMTNYKDGLILDQTFKSTNYKANRIVNRDAKKIINKSIFNNLNNVITTNVFFSKPKKEVKFLIRDDITNKFETACFRLVVIKFNQKIYSPIKLIKMDFLDYLNNSLYFFKSVDISVKISSNNFYLSK